MITVESDEVVADTSANLSGYLRSALTVLEEVERRATAPAAKRAVREVSRSLLFLDVEMKELFRSAVSNQVVSQGWVLNEGWHPLAFRVASSSDRVLLTLGAVAVRSVRQVYEAALDEAWDDALWSEFTRHWQTLVYLEDKLRFARNAIGN